MIKRKTVFCELEFLHEFLGKRPTMLEPNDNSIQQMECWMSLYKFICKSDLVKNITEDSFKTLCDENSWMSMLWKKSTQGECGLDFETDNFISIKKGERLIINESSLNSVYLTNADDTICKKYSKEYGIIVLNSSSIMDCLHLYKDNGTSFPDVVARNWSFLYALNGCTPPLNTCNALVIVDNYLFESNYKDVGSSKKEVTFSFQDKLEYNLKPILNSLLPDELMDGMFFEIVIASGKKDVDYEQQYNYALSIIRSLRPKLKFNLAFYNDASVFHDRCIVSNNVWISCGHGFDIFKKEGSSPSKSTTVNVVFPFIQSGVLWVDGSFLNLMRDLKKVVSRYNEEGKSFWGNNKGVCRMMSHYTEDKQKTSVSCIKSETSEPIAIGRAKILGKIDLSQFEKYNRRR